MGRLLVGGGQLGVVPSPAEIGKGLLILIKKLRILTTNDERKADLLTSVLNRVHRSSEEGSTKFRPDGGPHYTKRPSSNLKDLESKSKAKTRILFKSLNGRPDLGEMN